MSEPDASSTVKGITKLDVNPSSPTDPIAVGINSLRVEKILSIDYGNSFATAISQIGSSEVTLVVKEAITVTADVTLPQNITLDIKDAGLVTVSGSKIMTIASMVDAPNRQLFANGSGTNEIYLLKGGTSFINLAWWAGKTPSSNADWAVRQCLTSIFWNNGGRWLIPPGNWVVTGNYTLPDGTLLEGCGTYPDGTRCSAITLDPESEEDCVFRIGDDFRNIAIRDVVLDVGEESSATAALLIDGDAPNTGIGIFCTNVVFRGGSTYNLMIEGDGAWEFEQVSLDCCQFLGGTCAGIYINSVNGLISIDTPVFFLPSGSNGVHIHNCGDFTMKDHYASGIHGSPECNHGLPDPIRAGNIIYIDGHHLNVNIHGGQDEGFAYFLVNDDNYKEFPINLYGVNCASPILLNEGCSINVVGGNFAAHAIKAAASANAVVFSFGEYVQDIDYCFASQPRQLCDFTGTNSVHVADFSPYNTYSQLLQPLHIAEEPVNFGNLADPLLMVASAEVDKKVLFIGQVDADKHLQNGYFFFRDSYGVLQIEGNQSGFINLQFNGETKTENAFTASATLAQITANQNDYALGSIAGVLRLSSNAAYNITGIVAPTVERRFRFVNVGAFNLTFLHNSSSSSASNRFLTTTSASLVLPENGMMEALYDITSGRWRIGLL